MTPAKLTYFDFSGSRGEECRLALHIAGMLFEDLRVSRDEWKKLKPRLPFRSMPVLEIDGHPPLSQVNTILRFIGRRHGLLSGNDDWHIARLESLMDAVEDIRARIASTFGIDNAQELKTRRTALVDGALKNFAECMESQVVGPFAGGKDLSVADIKIYVLMDWIHKGVLEHVPTDLFASCTQLNRLFQTVDEHPKVVEWHARSQSSESVF